MKIVFDQGTPVPLRRQLVGHAIMTAHEQGWTTLTNGALLEAAERAGFDVLITTDQNLRYQQNLTGRRLALVIHCARILSRLPAPGVHSTFAFPRMIRDG
jgi:hypothetical protein